MSDRVLVQCSQCCQQFEDLRRDTDDPDIIAIIRPDLCGYCYFSDEMARQREEAWRLFSERLAEDLPDE